MELGPLLRQPLFILINECLCPASGFAVTFRSNLYSYLADSASVIIKGQKYNTHVPLTASNVCHARCDFYGPLSSVFCGQVTRGGMTIRPGGETKLKKRFKAFSLFSDMLIEFSVHFDMGVNYVNQM